MVHIGPVGEKDITIESAAILHRSHAAVIVLHWFQQRLIQVHEHELRDRIQGNVFEPRVVQVESVIVSGESKKYQN